MNISMREISAEQTLTVINAVTWYDQGIAGVVAHAEGAGTHYGLFEGGVLISVMSVFIQSDRVQFRKLATLPSHQGQGLTERLLAYVMTELQRKKITTIWCNARKERVRHYQCLGMTSNGQVFSENGRDFVVMERVGQRTRGRRAPPSQSRSLLTSLGSTRLCHRGLGWRQF